MNYNRRKIRVIGLIWLLFFTSLTYRTFSADLKVIKTSERISNRKKNIKNEISVKSECGKTSNRYNLSTLNNKRSSNIKGFLAKACKVKISPPIGAPIVDNQHECTGVHDDLYARVLVISDQYTKLAIISLDIEGFDISWSNEVRKKILSQTDINVVILNATHSHSAPFLMPWNRNRNEWFFTVEGTMWRKHLLRSILNAVNFANNNLVVANLKTGRASIQVGFNRRLPTNKGIVMRPNPDGKIIPWVDILYITDAFEKPLSVLFSHAAHPVIIHNSSTLISADFPGFANNKIEHQLGENVIALFAQGCSGDINGYPLQGEFDAAQEAGEKLGEAVLKAINECEKIETEKILFTSSKINLPFQDLPSQNACKIALLNAENNLKIKNEQRLKDKVFFIKDLLVKSEKKEKQWLPFEIQILSIGDHFCLVTMPHEIFAEYHLWIESNSPYNHNMVFAYTGGCESYVPTDLDLSLGGYEAAHTLSSDGITEAALFYPYRAALKPGVENQIKEEIQRLFILLKNEQ